MKPVLIPLKFVQFDADTQLRDAISDDVVADYAEQMEAGEKFPPVDLFEDVAKGGAKIYFLADGWHRIRACQMNGDSAVQAIVRQGGKKEAIAYALSANARHGLKRSNADKAKAVKVAFREFSGMSDRAIAELCAVTHPFVGKIRDQVVTVTTSSANELTKRTGIDGKKYAPAMPAKPKATPAPVIHLSGSGTPLPYWKTPETMSPEEVAVWEAMSAEERTKAEQVHRDEAARYASMSPEQKRAEDERVAAEAFAQAATPPVAAKAATARAPILKPSQASGAFDSAAWKAQTADFLKAQWAKLPAKHRGAAAEFVRQFVDTMQFGAP